MSYTSNRRPVTELSRAFAAVSLLFLVLMLSSPLAEAQKKSHAIDPYPLRPPDTSSPRDTLRSFLTNADAAISAWRRDAMDPRSQRALLNALSTLDFSTTSQGDSWSVQVEYSLLLKEILDRLEVPPYNKIPGDDETVHGGVTRWTIPNTRISIARIEYGPRAGEFLFSAPSVQRIKRSYILAKDLPYKPTASTPGIYEAYLSSKESLIAHERRIRDRLQGVDTSDPRSTLTGFLESIDSAYALVKEGYTAAQSAPQAMREEKARQIRIEAEDLLERALATLDLSQVPKAYRHDIGIEVSLQLKEIIDRTMLPLLESVPDARMVRAAREQDSQSSSQNIGPFRWRYPNTEIEIVEIMEGERQGEFLFSASTVDQIGQFYHKVRDLPYRRTGPEARQYNIWSTPSEGFYAYYIASPGYLIPYGSFLFRFIQTLPPWLKTMHNGQMLWKWIGLLLCVFAVALTTFMIFRIIRSLAKRLGPPKNRWLMILAPVIVIIVVIAIEAFIKRSLRITGEVLNSITIGSTVIVVVMVIWAVSDLCRAVAETIISLPRMREKSLDASLLRIAGRFLAFLIGAWIFIVSLRDLGADLIPLLAGLGVGGLAVALAAQRTLANFIGSLILFATKPVKPGDFCRYGDQIGTVEHIGMLSTRIRSLERTIITVPNAEFSEMKLDNFTLRDQRLLHTTLQLRYETTPEQMRYILAKLRELLLRHPKVADDPARVRFVEYGAYSKDVEIFAYLHCQDQGTFLAIKEDILLRVEDIINEAGSGFAFPSQTAYLSQDPGLDAKRGSAVETQVEQWRAGGKLPFPEFEDKERRKIKDTLDYPPEGSPDYKPPAGKGE